MPDKKAKTDHPIQEALAARWSPYAFADRPVAEADIRSIFEAARWAASSYNEQPWSYILATPLAFAAGWAWPGLFNLAIVRANPAAPGFATSVTQTGTYVGAGLGPLAFGLIVGHGGYSWAWLATSVAALLAATAVITGRSRLRALGLSTGRRR